MGFQWATDGLSWALDGGGGTSLAGRTSVLTEVASGAAIADALREDRGRSQTAGRLYVREHESVESG
jgi:hypothetical protein